MVIEAEISKRIREFCRKKNLTLQQPADKTGYSKANLSRVDKLEKAHPDSTLGFIAGILHNDLGQEIPVVIVLKLGIDAAADELCQYVKSQVAPYQYPRVIKLGNKLPKTAAGKTLKRAITIKD